MSAVRTIDETGRDRAVGHTEDRPGAGPVIDLTADPSAVRPAPGQCPEGTGCKWLAAIAVQDTGAGTVRWSCADHAVELVRDHAGTVQAVDVHSGLDLGPETVRQIIADLHADAGVPSTVVPDGGPFRPETGSETVPGTVRDRGLGRSRTVRDEDRCGDCNGAGFHPDRDGAFSGLAGLPVVCGCTAPVEMPDMRALVTSWLPSADLHDLPTRLAVATQLAEALAPLVESLAGVMSEAVMVAGSAFLLNLPPADQRFDRWLDDTGAQALGAALDRLSKLAWVQ